MKFALGALVLAAVFVAGCTTEADAVEPTFSPTASPGALAALEPTLLPSPTAEAIIRPTATASPAETPTSTAIPAGDGLPTIRASASPSNPDRGETFTLTVSSEDDVGVKTLSWESTDSFSKQPASNSFECSLQKTCTASWEFASSTNGSKTIAVYATDSSGQKTGKVPMEINVRPFDYKPRPSPSPTTSAPACGNSFCDKGEAYETCPGDCPYSGFKCANAKCEGGESYQSCPQDCSVSAIIGSACGDGACEPGEDAKNCPGDCTSIKPNCGNNVCDSWETQASCRADCEAAAGTTACSSNAACGYKQICQSGKCVSVQCTNDAQCGYAKECENNRCVRCPSGPYGPAC